MQRIYIENFGPIKTADIELKDALLFIGEQASGKSTISKLIYFFKSLRADLLSVIYENTTSNEKEIQELLFKKITEKFYNFFGPTSHFPDFKVKYHYSDTKFVELILHHDKKLELHLSPNFFGNSSILKEAKNLRNAIELTAFELEYIKKLAQLINNIFEDHRAPLFIPAGRNVIVTYSALFDNNFYNNLISTDLGVDAYLMADFLKRVQRLKKQFQVENLKDLIAHKLELGYSVNEHVLKIAQDKFEAILKGQYRYRDFGELLVYDTEKNQAVRLNDASSGQQEAIRILQDIFLVLLEQEDVFRVIEEPEAHLYPMAQKHLIEMMALMLNGTNSQLIITTHSPYILSIFNNLLFASRIAKMNESVKPEVNAVIDESMWLNPTKCQAYALQGGNCVSILNPATGLIGENYLDDISVELGADFDELYHLHGRAFK